MRKDDSGWRDRALADWHQANGFECPAPGMVMPMIEYDRGKAVGIVNYIRRGDELPTGAAVGAAYRAFGSLCGAASGEPLPFLTAVYDPRNWSVQLYPHNTSARMLTADSWLAVSEYNFARLLYGMRGRRIPDLSIYGVEYRTSGWFSGDPAVLEEQPWPCADMSARRRAYEPAATVPMREKVPCMDVDFTVVDQEDYLALVVDYKRHNALADTQGTNATALASLTHRNRKPVAAAMVRYSANDGEWWFEAFPLNHSATGLFSFALGHGGGSPDQVARAVAGKQWVRMSGDQWLGILRCVRDL